MSRFSMEDMKTAPPSAAELAHLEIQKQKQDRLMLKETRLAQTEARLERQRKDSARKERDRISQRDRALHQQRQAEAQREKQRQAEVDLDIDVAVAIHEACEETGFEIAPLHKEFIQAFMRQLRKAKVI